VDGQQQYRNLMSLLADDRTVTTDLDALSDLRLLGQHELDATVTIPKIVPALEEFAPENHLPAVK
jgi:hypothetical protein